MRRAVLLSALGAVLAAGLVGCDPEPMMDGGLDGAVDAGRDAMPPDAPPPMCDPACPSNQACCEGFVEPDGCFDLRNDPSHCGACSVDCVATNRGDICQNSNCTCGIDVLGCLGTRESFCCPPRVVGGQRYCANLDTSPADCGDCDRGCDGRRADRCDGGRCQCGDMRGQCDGTPDSVCCRDGADVGCVNTLTDRFHCGACNVICQSGERCENGSCVRGDSCSAACALGEICCNGDCCNRFRCVEDVCTVSPDGGMPVDGGAPGDGGVPPDGGPGDAGPPDAGPGDGGPPRDAGSDAG